MHFSFAAATAVLALASSVVASPVSNAASNAETRSPINKYNLKTKVVGDKPSTGSNKDGLYLISYHTGAGLGAGGLATTPSGWWYTGADNQQYWTYEGAYGPWPLQVVQYGPYQAWVPVTISESGPTYKGEGFYFDGDKGLVFNQTNAGWLACDWWYSYPELFLHQAYYNTTAVPESCSQVELVIDTIYD